MPELFDPNRPLFSQREGIDPLPVPFQLGEIDIRLKAELIDWVVNDFNQQKKYLPHTMKPLYSSVFAEIENKSLHQSQADLHTNLNKMVLIFEKGNHYQILNLLEAYQKHLPDQSARLKYLFDKHKAAYALINDDGWYRFIPRTSIEDSAALQQNLADLSGDKYHAVRTHLHDAITVINARDGDATNFGPAIADSIQAVETACKIATGDPKIRVKAAVKLMPETDMTIHRSFQDAVAKLYGFTSDAGGLRHGGGGQYDLADALYMLSICAAICSYIIQKLPVK